MRASSVAPGGVQKRSKCHSSHGPAGTELGVIGLDRAPAELRHRRRADLGAEYRREHLAAVTEAEHRHVALDGEREQLALGGDAGVVHVAGHAVVAERGDPRVAPGSGTDGSTHVRSTSYGHPARIQPLAEQRGGRGVDVLADQDRLGRHAPSIRSVP